MPRCLLDNQAAVATVDSAAKEKGEPALVAKVDSAAKAMGELALATVGLALALALVVRCTWLVQDPGQLAL